LNYNFFVLDLVINQIVMKKLSKPQPQALLALTFISIFLLMSCQKDSLEKSAALSVPNASSAAAPRDSSVVSYFNFDTSIGDWYEKSTYYGYSATLSDVVKKRGKSVRFELKKGENKRSELAVDPHLSTAESWYGFSIYIPASFTYDVSPESLVQFHSLPDFESGEDWRSPPVMLGVMKDRLILDIRTSTKKVNKQDDFTFEREDLGVVSKNVWVDYVVHAKWAYDHTGVLEIWQNKKLIYTRSQKANRYNDVAFPYIKLGIYKWDWAGASNSMTTDRVVYFDEVRIGNKFAGFNGVATGF
jgi:hypothetical protein